MHGFIDVRKRVGNALIDALMTKMLDLNLVEFKEAVTGYGQGQHYGLEHVMYQS
jgi:hypothetical protein